MNKIVVNHKTVFINYLYFMLLEIQELDPQSKRLGGKTRIVNIYDNRIRRGCIWNDRTSRTKRVLEDINWNLVIKSQVLIARDINAYSLVWNFHYNQRENTFVLKEIIKEYSLSINNKSKHSTEILYEGILVPDLALTTTPFNLLTL